MKTMRTNNISNHLYYLDNALKRGSVLYDRRRYGNTTFTWITGFTFMGLFFSFKSDPFQKITPSKEDIRKFIIKSISSDSYQIQRVGRTKTGCVSYYLNEIVYTGQGY